MRYKLAVYDWNGTLVNDVVLAYAYVAHIFKTFAPHLAPPSMEDYRNEISAADFKKFYHRHGIPERVTLDDMYKIRTSYYNRHLHEAKLHDNAVELLVACKLVRMKNAIVSAASEKTVSHLAHFGIEHCFDNIIFGARRKEDALVETLDFFGVKAEDAFYLNDTCDGLEDAKKLGMATVGFTGGYNSKERILLAQPTYVVDSLKEVIRILKGSET